MERIGLDHESSETTTLSLPHPGTSRAALSQNLDIHPSQSTEKSPGKDARSAGASGVFSDVEWVPARSALGSAEINLYTAQGFVAL
jgi:hypothetical protein